ncbi:MULTISPECIES: hypothetical protein [unclassified Novosphingobium]|uniref:hypothetical protein n=1 Tax=unclassified Novosphingobium TaxID=2644732 RepID=UPI000A910C23|nr:MULTISPECIES: hypothetical protein [unclassified Novosphingobium]MBN9142738.1 hypothetical protein [Novosphingobium sp.]MDR6705822.1 hypothetical protein [Novosphingobium sp. 1748]NKJ00137.1 hypothetical protein [Novosphingobium sp. SG707]
MNRWLYLAGLAAATLAAFAVPLSVFLPMGGVMRPLTFVAATPAVCLFLRILFSRTYRDKIDAINIEMRDGQPAFSFRSRKPLLDPEWGMFGTRTGSRPAQVLRAVLFVEAGVTMLLSQGRAELVGLVMAGLFAAMLVTMLQMASGEA